MTRTLLLLFLLAATSLLQAQDPAATAAAIARAHTARQPAPLVSADPAVSLAVAYRIQGDVVRLIVGDSPIGGFKAGLTGDAIQKRFAVDQPLAGVLPARGRYEPGDTIYRDDFGALMLETELGFIAAAPITGPVADIAALKALFTHVAPAIELPDLAFADMNALKGVDIAAANVGARGYIVGAAQSIGARDLNAAKVTLTRDGQAVNTGAGSDALGDQWQALLWLVNTTIAHGYRIETGQVLITGALGAMIPGKPGAYLADFGALGSIAFQVE